MKSHLAASLKDVGVHSPGAGGRWMIRHVDLQISNGEIITIVGPNGSGKSTTLKVLLGIIAPGEGEVWRSSGKKISYVPQALSIETTMPVTVERMLRLGRNYPQREMSYWLEKFQITHLLHAQINSLSGGELQRALIARAMLAKPDLLVMDEPGQGVDFSGQIEIYDAIRSYRDDTGASILLVSHDLHLVMAASDQVICMNGHICCSGTPQSVASNPQYLKLFGPKAAETVAFYRHEHDHVHLADGRVRHADGSLTDDCHLHDGHHHGS